MMNEIGKPLHFDVDVYLDAVEMMIASDEVERAFHMLDNMPAYYRDNQPDRAVEIRSSLHKQLFTPTQYKDADDECEKIDPDKFNYWPGRASVVASILEHIKDSGKAANIMEIGPGSFWLPFVLRKAEFSFTYEYQSLTKRELPFEKPKGDEVNIFIAFELIEHLSNELEIYQSYLKFKKTADYVLLSTPLYTCGAVNKNWREHSLGHLRTYTPHELLEKANKMFIGYNWKMFLDNTIVLIGEKK